MDYIRYPGVAAMVSFALIDPQLKLGMSGSYKLTILSNEKSNAENISSLRCITAALSICAWWWDGAIFG
jgi:hypothetical protein